MTIRKLTKEELAEVWRKVPPRIDNNYTNPPGNILRLLEHLQDAIFVINKIGEDRYPFSFDKYTSGNYVVKTRKGEEVTQLTKFDIKSEFCLCGVINSRIYKFKLNGVCDSGDDFSNLDLFLHSKVNHG